MENVIRNEQVSGFLAGISALDFILTIIAIVAVISFIVALSIKGYKLLEKYRRLKNESEEREEKIQHYEENIKTLTQISEQQKEDIAKLNEKMNTVFAMLIEIRNHDDDNRRASLKDRISQAYRHYHDKKKWTKIDKETLEGLISSYESCGGTNSFVHELVQKEMYTWEVVDEDED